MNKTVAVIVVLVISFILVVVVACSRIQESGEVEATPEKVSKPKIEATWLRNHDGPGAYVMAFEGHRYLVIRDCGIIELKGE